MPANADSTEPIASNPPQRLSSSGVDGTTGNNAYQRVPNPQRK